MLILGLDISSATIGWSILEVEVGQDIRLKTYGHIKPTSKKKSDDNFSFRLNYAFDAITNLVQKEKPDVVAIEDYAKKFSKGKSSANTILILSSFNEVCGLATYRVLKSKPIRMPVTSLRKLVKTKYSCNIDDKEDVLNFCKKTFNNFLTQNNRAGNIKKECYDEADSIIVALGYYLEHSKLSKP
jgi:Holliday junction resolvasome RuvABC endonuclease subunit